MLTWQQIVQDYIIKHSNIIKQTTLPLRQRLGIGYFTYHRIDNDGKYTVLVDRPDWAEHYVTEKYYLTDPFLRNPDVYQSGFCLLEAPLDESHAEKVLKAGKDLFDLDQGLILIEKQADCVEFFGFSGNRATCSLDKIYLNTPYILQSFAQHFKTTMSPLLIQMQEASSSLIDLKGNHYHYMKPIQPHLDQAHLKGFLGDIGLKSMLEKANHLTPREKECLQLLTEGKSAKETAYLLKLSPRTVEFYFENIKNKLTCHNKQEIFIIAKLLIKLRLIP